MCYDVNLYSVNFVSKGTGPQTVRIEAQNSAGAKITGAGSLPRSLQHQTEPVAIVWEREVRIVAHAMERGGDGEAAKAFRAGPSEFP
jgi:hypothetical protein